VQQFTHRWVRRLGIAALWVMGLGAAAVAAPSLWTFSTDLWTFSTELTAPPVRPPLPAARPLLLAPAVKVPRLPETLPPDVAVAGDKNGTGIETPQ